VPDSLQQYVGFTLIVVADEVERRYAHVTYDLGISLRDFVLLAEIARRSGLSQATLAKHVGLGRSRVSEQLLALDTAGYVEREIDVYDLRRRKIWISRNGQEALGQATELLTASDRGWLAVLDRRERTAFVAGLRRLAPAHTRRTQWIS
jgi:DNA-binding MarR family transcriptional regulator